MARGIFVTGTDTEVGKTWMTVALMRLLQAQGHQVLGMKPVASGCQSEAAGLRNDDALLLQETASLQMPYEMINPFAFEPAIAPHIAADQAGKSIDFSVIKTCYQSLSAQADYVLVEGVGGWAVPLAGRQRVSDLALSLNLPVVLVIGLRLGGLNHALLTLEAIERSGLRCLGWIANEVDPKFACVEENFETLLTELEAPCLGRVPFMNTLNPERIMSCFGGVIGELDEY